MLSIEVEIFIKGPVLDGREIWTPSGLCPRLSGQNYLETVLHDFGGRNRLKIARPDEKEVVSIHRFLFQEALLYYLTPARHTSAAVA